MSSVLSAAAASAPDDVMNWSQHRLQVPISTEYAGALGESRGGREKEEKEEKKEEKSHLYATCNESIGNKRIKSVPPAIKE